MKATKMSLVMVLALVLSLSLASSSWARPRRGGWGGGPGVMNLTPEQAGKLFDLRHKFMRGGKTGPSPSLLLFRPVRDQPIAPGPKGQF
jgi:hypothetical protein